MKKNDLEKYFGPKKEFDKAVKLLTKPTLNNFSTFNIILRDNNTINYNRLYNKIISDKDEVKGAFDKNLTKKGKEIKNKNKNYKLI